MPKVDRNKKKLEKLDKKRLQLPKKPESMQAEIIRLQRELENYRKLCEDLMEERVDLQNQIVMLEAQYSTVANSEFWKATKPFRKMMDWLKKILKKNKVTRNICKGLICLKQNGIRYTARRVKIKLQMKGLAKHPLYTREQLEQQRKTVFKKKIKISILVPLYNTPEEFLKEMITSVKEQTYANWELCLADGSDEKHANVEAAVKKIAKDDARIVYRRLEKNLGISGNTNACIEMASGDYIALFDHDDILHPAALYEVMKAICEKNADFIYTDENTFTNKITDAYCPHFKPEFSPDLLRSYNYICHFTVFDAKLLEKTGVFRPAFDGSQDYDMILRLTEQAKHIVHIPRILYYWRAHANSVASDVSAKPYTIDAAKRALSEHLTRVGLCGTVETSKVPSTYRIKYDITDEPLVSIIIPNMDHIEILDKCIRSVEDKSTYRNFEILIVENNSRKPKTFEYYESICKEFDNIRILRWEYEFNYSKINNFAIRSVSGAYTILLNNDIEILTPSWIEEMLMFAQRPDVGAVGMMLYYPDDTVQHAGVILGIGGVAGHSHKYFARGDYGYMSRMTLAQNLSAVTAACMMVKTEVLREIGGFDEKLAVAFNDIDLCMKIRRAGHLIVFTPYAEAYHYESKSRGLENTPEKQKRFRRETNLFMRKWELELLRGDPYYSPNLTLEREDFSIKT